MHQAFKLPCFPSSGLKTALILLPLPHSCLPVTQLPLRGCTVLQTILAAAENDTVMPTLLVLVGIYVHPGT